MLLFLLRHAEAETQSSSGLDRDRVLTVEGRKQAERIGLHWRAEQLQFDKILVSSAKRTRETISLCLEHSGFLTEVKAEPRLYNADTQTLIDVLLEQEAESILMCGHNPSVGELAVRLTGELVRFTPGTLCAIQLDPWQENEEIRGHVVFLKRPE